MNLRALQHRKPKKEPLVININSTLNPNKIRDIMDVQLDTFNTAVLPDSVLGFNINLVECQLTTNSYDFNSTLNMRYGMRYVSVQLPYDVRYGSPDQDDRDTINRLLIRYLRDSLNKLIQDSQEMSPSIIDIENFIVETYNNIRGY